MRELFHQPPKQKTDPHIPEDRPVYRILAEKGFFGPDDTLYPEGSVIALWDTPNEDMEPLNDMARKALEEYIDVLEDSAKKVAEKNGRYYAGRPRSKEEMISAASEDARRVQSIGNPQGVALMGAKMDTSKRIGQIGDEAIPEVAAKIKQRSKVESLA